MTWCSELCRATCDSLGRLSWYRDGRGVASRMLQAPALGVWQVGFRQEAPGPLQRSHSWPLRSGLSAAAGRVTLCSELLQAAVHLPLALLPSPGPALRAELLQVFFKVLVVHGPVAGGLTVRLGDKGE